MPPAAAPLCQSKLPAYPFFPPPTILTLVCSDAQPHCMPLTFFPPAKIYPLFDSKLIWAFTWLLVHVSKDEGSVACVSVLSEECDTRVMPQMWAPPRVISHRHCPSVCDLTVWLPVCLSREMVGRPRADWDVWLSELLNHSCEIRLLVGSAGDHCPATDRSLPPNHTQINSSPSTSAR